jgi:polyisoprenoid-binding protein YceI
MRSAVRAALGAVLFATLATHSFSAPPPAATAATVTVTHYVLDPAKSSLEFNFSQAGAQNRGRFRRFTTVLDFAADHLEASHLEVSVDMTSVDTGDQERDDTLKDADLFAVKKFAQARFSAAQLVKTPSGYEAVGRLTIRDMTRELRVPFTLRTATEQGAGVAYMSGKTSLRRLDFGVGQGDWKATDQVGNDVGVSFALRLTAR